MFCPFCGESDHIILLCSAVGADIVSKTHFPTVQNVEMVLVLKNMLLSVRREPHVLRILRAT